MPPSPPKKTPAKGSERRDTEGYEALRARTAVPESIDFESATGRVDIDEEEKERIRSNRPTDIHINHLARRMDRVEIDIGETRQLAHDTRELVHATREMTIAASGKLDVIPTLIDEVRKNNERLAKREDITFEMKGRIGEAQEKGAIEVTVDNKKTRNKIVAGVVLAIPGGAVLHWILQHFGVL